jgi:hypothetical protein
VGSIAAVRRRWPGAIAMSVAIVLAGALVGTLAPVGAGAAGTTLRTSAALKLKAGQDVVQGSEMLRLRVRSPWRGRLRIEERLRGEWRALAQRRTGGDRRLALSVRLRGPSGTVRRVRARFPSRDRVSRQLRIRKLAAPAGSEEAAPSFGDERLYAQWRGIDAATNWQYQEQADAEREVAEAAALGADTVRLGLYWSWMEPNAPGQYREDGLTRFDRLLEVASSHGLRVIVTVLSTPCWALPPDAQSGCQPGVYHAEPPADPAAFGRFISFVSSRWGDRLSGIEVWNEPNQEAFFGGTPADYSQLVRAAHDAVQQSRPGLPVAAGALALADAEYLRELYRLGVKQWSDAISIHPYDLADGTYGDPRRQWPAEMAKLSYSGGVPSIHQVMREHGDDAPLWLTEFGYPSCPATPHCVEPEKQGEYLVAALRQAARWDYVEVMLLFRLRDWYPGGENLEYHFGLLERDWTPKPGHSAVRDELAFLARSD